MWDVYYHPVSLENNQQFGTVASPNCGLTPETRTAFTERGYSTEKKIQDNGGTLVSLYSFTVEILYKDTKGKTIRLNIEYPIITDHSIPGYEFIYNVLTR